MGSGDDLIDRGIWGCGCGYVWMCVDLSRIDQPQVVVSVMVIIIIGSGFHPAFLLVFFFLFFIVP